MIKINYKEPEETETMDEVARHNIQICDKYKKADYLELSCISWLKIDSTRNYQDLEELFRFMNLDSHVIANTISHIPNGLKIGKPNDVNDTNKTNEEKLEYVAKITCMKKEDSIKELLKHHTSYEENYEYLKKTGCLMAIENKPSEEEEKKIANTSGVDEVKKLLDCKLKLDLELYKPIDSINNIIKDFAHKYGKEPEKIICGEVGNNKVWALMLDGQIISPIGWIEKNVEQTELNQNNVAVEYELIDFRKIKIEKP